MTGRDLKSALGRFSFVAGALQHVRPFLGPIFAWAAVLSPGTFAKFPEAVAVLLDFIQGEVVKEAMTRPRRLESRPVEKFRVDAKAEADLIVIGGWEIPASGRTEDARWFSICSKQTQCSMGLSEGRTVQKHCESRVGGSADSHHVVREGMGVRHEQNGDVLIG